MATKSKMSTSTSRKVTATTTPPPKETREQYEKKWADYEKSHKENKEYASKVSAYEKKMQDYKRMSSGGKYVNTSGTRPMTSEEIKRHNAFWSKRNPESHMNITKGSRIEKGVKIDPSGDYTGKYGKDPNTGKELSWSQSGSTKAVFSQPIYEKPVAPGKPAPLGRQPYNPEYEPKLALKKPGSVKSSSEPAKIIKPKLTKEVPVAIEKPTRKGTMKGSGINFKRATSKEKAAIKAAKAENKATRPARRSFNKEERLAKSYLKNQGIFEGDTKKEMKAGIKSYAKAKKAETGKIDKTTRQAIKTGKTAAKYVGRQEKGKIRSFTPEALAKRKTVSAKVETTTTGKGKGRATTKTIVASGKAKGTQAGRKVY